MDAAGNGTPARYIECMQWMLAPTAVDGGVGNPGLAPDIVSNSWVCPISEGCTTGYELETAVDNLVSAGVFYVASAGNEGSADLTSDNCRSIYGPPAIYDASFVVGATDSSEALAYFSSRGPVADINDRDNVTSMKTRPDVSAPGVNVYSAWPTNTYASISGTSMAAPHVAGTAALLISAFPALRGHPDRIASVLQGTAVPDVANTAGVTQTCGGTPITQWPNYMAGYGRVDAWNAYHEIVFMDGFDG
jgi:subtilisin family serine protease